MITYDLIVIGAGPAGMLAAIHCKKAGMKNILVIEKNIKLGGLLLTSDYNVFEDRPITGQEYLKQLEKEYDDQNIETLLSTMVLNISEDGYVVCTSAERGIEEFKANKILIANGGKEKGRHALNMPGDRVAGLYSLGTAKQIALDPTLSLGNSIVLFGTKHLDTIETVFLKRGYKISAVINPTGDSFDFAPADHSRCYDFYTISQILGDGRIEKLIIKNGLEVQEIACDTLIFADGWLSDGVVSMRSGLALNPETTGPKVTNDFETSRESIYASGNAIFIHESMEDLIEEAKRVAKVLLS